MTLLNIYLHRHTHTWYTKNFRIVKFGAPFRSTGCCIGDGCNYLGHLIAIDHCARAVLLSIWRCRPVGSRYLFLTSELVLWWVLTTDCPFFTSEADYLGILKESIDTTHLLYIVVVEEEWMMPYLHLHIAEMFVIYLYTLNGWQAFYSELSVLYPNNTKDFPV